MNYWMGEAKKTGLKIRHKYPTIGRMPMVVVAIVLTLAGLGGLTQPGRAETGSYPHDDAIQLGIGTNMWGYEDCIAYCSYFSTMNGVRYYVMSQRGYNLRNCTDYVAWKLQSLGVSGAMTSGLGNGGQWAASAVNKGLSVTSTPKAFTVGVEEGSPGHVAFVESVAEDGTLKISEYNYGSNGNYHERTGKKEKLRLTKFIDFGITAPAPPTPPADTLPSNSTAEYGSGLYVLARGTNKQIYANQWENNTWSGFGSIQDGATFASDPTAIAYNAGLHVFARGVDNQIYKNTKTGTTWSGFQNLQNGATFASDPVVAQYGNWIGAYAIGTNGQLYRNSWGGSGNWTGFQSIQTSAVFTGKPAVITFNSKQFVFAKGVDNQIYKNSWDGTNWSGFEKLHDGAVFAGDPVVVRSGSWIGVYARGIDGQIYGNSSADGNSWGGFASLDPGAVFEGNPSLAQFGSSLSLLARGVDGQIYNNYTVNGQWHGFYNLQPGAVFAGDPVAVKFGSALGIVARGTNGQLYNNTWNGYAWSGFGSLQNGAIFMGPDA